MTSQLQNRFRHAPKAIRTLLKANIITEIDIGCSPTSVFRVTSCNRTVYLKVHPRSPHFTFAHEVSILRWLSGQLPVPSIHEYDLDDDNEYLVLSSIPGDNGLEAMKYLGPKRLVELLAFGLRRFHALGTSNCPFDERISAKLERARYRLCNNLVDEADFDAVRLGMSGWEVFTALQEQRPNEDVLVVSHGDYCLPNILFQGQAVSGFIDLDRVGVADRYNDLAIASRSIAYNLGLEYEPYFFANYGVDSIDHRKVDYYRMMDELF